MIVMAAQRRLACCFNPLERLKGPEPAPACVCMSQLCSLHVAPGQSRAGEEPGSMQREGASASVLCLLGASAQSPSRCRAERAPPEPGLDLLDVGSGPMCACSALSLGVYNSRVGHCAARRGLKVMCSLNARGPVPCTPQAPRNSLCLFLCLSTHRFPAQPDAAFACEGQVGATLGKPLLAPWVTAGAHGTGSRHCGVAGPS